MMDPKQRRDENSGFAGSSFQDNRYVVCVIPSAREHEMEGISLTSAMHSLVLDRHAPITLELTGTATQRRLLIRSKTQEGLDHAVTQLRARYPQADFRRMAVTDDPFVLRPGETVSAVELKAGAASYLPLRSWQENDVASTSAQDPLVGVLGALDQLPNGVRVISQLALIPAPVNWSRRDQRKALEHALEPERQQERQTQIARQRQAGEQAPGFPLLLLGVVLLLLIISYRQGQTFLPALFLTQATAFIQGLISPHHGQASLPGALPLPLFLLLGVLCLLFIGIDQLRRRARKLPLYDQALVGHKTSQMAYRVRFRLYIICDAHCVETKRNLSRSGLFTPLFSFLYQRRKDQYMLARLIAAYRQYHLASGNYFVPKRLSLRRAVRSVQGYHGYLGTAEGWWSGLTSSRHIMSVDTLASLWHLPTSSLLSTLAFFEHTSVRTLPLPLPLAQRSIQGEPIGISQHAGHHVPVMIPHEALATHLFIGGKSGEGKSTCLEYLACEAMQQGGLVVIDPHGDLVEHILALVPEQRIDDVVLLDLSDGEHVIGFNPLDASLGRGRDKAISDLLKTLAHIWASSWGSRMENAFEYALRTLFEANRALVAQGEPQRQYTLLDVMMVLTNEHFCQALLCQIEDPFILRWWNLYYNPLNPLMQRERSDPVLSKVAKFESQLARRIVGQSLSTVNFTDCIQQEKIVLVKLAKGVVGEDVARLLGATLLGLLQITLEEQGNLVEQQRKRLGILIDEFQVLKGVDWGALAELRKYGAAFYLATQSLEYLADMDASLLHVVLANVKQYIVFHMSASDAEGIHAELGVESDDIVNLDTYMCYVKLLYQQHRQPTFSMKLSPPLHGDQQRAEQIRQASQNHYTVSAPLVDEQLRNAMAASLMLMPPWDDDAGQPTSPQLKDEKPSASLARQHHGYRGRKSEEKREKAHSAKQQEGRV
ncbi:type IV secretion system DNA-binding domain-containing protein [Dictyobacter kobayashii]|uniref:Type IV secretion system coupling protein TraD DNA-binding domain-containing protein n=1 Tax=Dictyobacter kobayashii TaxID=2014872 RepID=A0A402AVQ7_9CHLR|nr:type IV secretion system DNA-binding domain-containing protein [Dictyobacter kobayashii]GCE23230.1 hypothetical protein KDK_70300 [Dictyobacter kobayashii]